MGRSFGWDRKNRVPCHSRCGTIKIPPCSTALSTEQRTKFCSLLTVASPYKWKILERDVKQYVINQSILITNKTGRLSQVWIFFSKLYVDTTRVHSHSLWKTRMFLVKKKKFQKGTFSKTFFSNAFHLFKQFKVGWTRQLFSTVDVIVLK
jgi:hypothetical protein